MGNVLECLFLLCCLSTYVTGDSNVIGSLQPVVAFVGDDVILPCHLEPPFDVSGLTIEWSNPKLDKRLVHVRRNGRDVSDTNPSYQYRTTLFTGEPENGNVSLKLSRVKRSDEGMYRCYLPTLRSLVKETVIEFKIGDSNVIGSLQPVVAFVGNDVILSCHLEPPLDVRGLTIEWSKPNLRERLVHVWRNGTDVSNTNPSDRYRTTLFTGELKNGNVSLKLSRVQISDEGMYRCFLPSLRSLVKEAVIELKIGTVSKPKVSIVGPVNNGVGLQCESGHWYPEPEVEWLDSEGHVLPADKTIFTPISRYNVKINVTVAEKGRFTCRVVQQNINQTSEAAIHITDAVFQASSSARGIVIGVSVVMVMLIIAGVVAVTLYRRKKAASTMWS